MATNVFFWCVAMFLVGPAAGYHCPQDCDSEGLLPEEVPTTFFPVEQVSQCAEPPSDREVLREALHCDNSTTGTGHLLYRELTGDVVAVERCYSFCFGSVCPLKLLIKLFFALMQFAPARSDIPTTAVNST